ncbi:xanthine dehydrogenase family protein molybdopterin-binding subunit [Sinorhizobium meliloti]|nr:xanthine dehydrogenase family protein molybdopterin-binding subunit [Sinorhizobium meliloti]
MGVEGIGARVARKEDKRFLTGKGRYTDDMVVSGMKYAVFVRSPHAHATIRSIDATSAKSMAGVIDVLDGKQLLADGIGNLICGWMIHSKDGSPMRMGAWRPLAHETVRYVGDAVAIVVADSVAQARDAAEAVVVDYETLPVVTDTLQALGEGEPQIHPEAPGNLIFDWELGDAGAADQAIAAAAHVTELKIINNRLSPNAMEPRATLGIYDAGDDHFTCYTTSQNPHLARLVMSAFYNVAPENKLRVIAPDVGGGFGSKIFIYPEEIVCLWASKRTGVPVKWTADRTEAFLTDAHGRDHVSTVKMAFDSSNRITALKVDTIANLGAYMSLFSSCVPTYLYATLLSGQYAIPAIHANVRTVYTNTAPVDAYRGAGRPEATYLLERTIETAARELGVSPAKLRRINFIRTFPPSDACDHELRCGRLRSVAQGGAMEAADWDGFAARKAEAERRGNETRHRHELLYRSLRTGAFRRRRFARCRRRPVGIGRGQGQRGRHHRGDDRLAQPRPGARDDLRPGGCGAFRRADRQRQHRPWRYGQGADGHGNLWFPLRRRRHVGRLQGARQGRGQGEKRLRPT